jgi:hypothetical protein
MRQSARWLFALSLALLTPRSAMADDGTAPSCGDAYTQAQTLRNARKLVKARDALRVCAQPTCKDFVVKDCTQWLDEVQAGLPTVVAVAKDAEGNALPNVKVFVDGQPLAIDVGRSIEVDPGPHTFTFQAADGTKTDKQVLIVEGEKEKLVTVTLGKPAEPVAPPLPTAAPPPTPPAASGGPAPPGDNAPSTSASGHASSSSFPWKTAGLVGAGVGVVGLGIGAVFGVNALSKKNDAHCDANNVCPDSSSANTLRDAGSAATASTVFFVAGAVLAAAGVTVWVLNPGGTVKAAPTAGANSAGLVLMGAW